MDLGTDHLQPYPYFEEPFTAEERSVLERFFTNTTGPVFALINLPEVVKGALFARYSRSAKSLRRLFLDEFYDAPGVAAVADAPKEPVRTQRAEHLYQKVFTEYGDDSVAQLGGVHLACEQASNLLTKVLEWGRLAAYLEQSTRYMFYDRLLGDRYRYLVPAEVEVSPLVAEYRDTLDSLFAVYGALTGRLTAFYEALHPRQDGDAESVHHSAVRAQVCDDLRGLLPAATLSNLGIYASGQAYELLLMRMRVHPLAEVRHYADLMLTELRKVIPSFVRRVDMPDRGEVWSKYLEKTARDMRAIGAGLSVEAEPRPQVSLVEWDPDAELKIAAAALYPHTDLPDDQLLAYAADMDSEQRRRIIETYIGDRTNRRHRPGRALERVCYRFDILCDYGIFRDLQRHRMLTLEWQPLGTAHGYMVPPALEETGAAAIWRAAMERAAHLHVRLNEHLSGEVAQYAVPFAFRVRFSMQMTAREAMHMLELRTQRGGHHGYRRVCAEMHRLIAEKAGHHTIAAAMRFVDHADYGLERLESERRAAARRAAAGIAEPNG
jgi:thymidylate synthase ThyX